MKGPSLHITAVASAGMHLTFFLFSMIILKQTSNVTVHSLYVVKLVGTNQMPDLQKQQIAVEKAEKSVTNGERDLKAIDHEKRLHEQTISDKIREIEKKKKTERKIEDSIDVIRGKRVIEEKFKSRHTILLGRKNASSTDTQVADKLYSGSPDGVIAQRYFLKVTEEIWREWIYPELAGKNLETIVFVKIALNGAVTIQGIAKSSGDSIFDNSAIRAITKASPVSRPPYEIEIGIRFYP